MDIHEEIARLVDNHMDGWLFECVSDNQLLQMLEHCIDELIHSSIEDVESVLLKIKHNAIEPNISVNTLLVSVFCSGNNMASDIEVMQRSGTELINNKNRTKFSVDGQIVHSLADAYIPSVIWVLIGLRKKGLGEAESEFWKGIESLYYQLPLIRVLTLLNSEFDIQRKKHSNKTNLQSRALKEDAEPFNVERKKIVQRIAKDTLTKERHLTIKQCISKIKPLVSEQLDSAVVEKTLQVDPSIDYAKISKQMYERWVEEIYDEFKPTLL
ncbi:hypothetical protein [Salinimonas iocasae]|uniref:Uncharacterized protein n=1 Tax=Salinimonas iocasae TaxID=2572577 RepID=A0A5B7YC81_9ALTE|nr:hypothetical protein [Salinimonas iocasae]QCZ92179.1 hypothetical protein FBQ74_01230 [Salinimonas iocasae]